MGKPSDAGFFRLIMARLGPLEEFTYLPVRHIVSDLMNTLGEQDISSATLSDVSRVVPEIVQLGLTTIELGMVVAGIEQRYARQGTNQRECAWLVRRDICDELKSSGAIREEDGDIVSKAFRFLRLIGRADDFWSSDRWGNYLY